MPAVIRDWRKTFGRGDFPFLMVQLAPWNAPLEPTWPELRDAQFYTTQVTPNTAKVVITDLGDPKDIHPPRKRPVGERLAAARHRLWRQGRVPGTDVRSRRVRGTDGLHPLYPRWRRTRRQRRSTPRLHAGRAESPLLRRQSPYPREHGRCRRGDGSQPGGGPGSSGATIRRPVCTTKRGYRRRRSAATTGH